MQALIILDAQNGILNKKDFSVEKQNILSLAQLFQQNQLPIFLVKHHNQDGFFLSNPKDIQIDKDIAVFSDHIIDKTTPSAFYQTNLLEELIKQRVDELVIVGFNIEYCVLFTAISAYDRGFKVHVIEDACGTTNDEKIYEMENLDINDFIGSIMNWSNVIDVHYFNEYLQLNDQTK